MTLQPENDHQRLTNSFNIAFFKLWKVGPIIELASTEQPSTIHSTMMMGAARGTLPITPSLDRGESPPTRSTQSRTASSSQSDTDESIDTTDVLPFFSISRFLRRPESGSEARVDMSEPSSSYGDDNDVPSLSSLEAGDYPETGRRLDPAPETAVPLTFEEKSRFFINNYPGHFHPPSCNHQHQYQHNYNNDMGGHTDSEYGSNSSGSLSSSQQDQLSCKTPSLSSFLDRQNILFPIISLSRDHQSCTTYMFSVLVGVVLLMVFIIFILVANLR